MVVALVAVWWYDFGRPGAHNENSGSVDSKGWRPAVPDNNDLINLGGRDFMRLHPVISLQHQAGAVVVERVIKGNPVNSVGRVSRQCRVLYGNIAPVGNFMGMNLSHANQSREAVRINLSMQPPGVPLFHRPYNNDQNFRVTLVDRQGIGNVNFFITEFVDGCSVYIEGSRTAPTAYHINAVSTMRRPSWRQFFWSEDRKQQADWQAKYAKMDQRFRTDGPVVKSVQNALPGTLPLPTKLENHDYMDDLGLNLALLQLNHKAPTILMGQTVDGFELMAQQGTVFGQRHAASGEWKFYVQRRAFLRYLHLNANGAPTGVGYQWLVESVQQFWPTAKTGRTVV